MPMVLGHGSETARGNLHKFGGCCAGSHGLLLTLLLSTSSLLIPIFWPDLIIIPTPRQNTIVKNVTMRVIFRETGSKSSRFRDERKDKSVPGSGYGQGMMNGQGRGGMMNTQGYRGGMMNQTAAGDQDGVLHDAMTAVYAENLASRWMISTRAWPRAKRWPRLLLPKD
jgi:hypothetical protein